MNRRNFTYHIRDNMCFYIKLLCLFCQPSRLSRDEYWNNLIHGTHILHQFINMTLCSA